MPPRRPDTPTARAGGTARRGRRALHQTIANGERELARVWSQTETGLRTAMRGLGLTDVDESRIITAARREMRASFDTRVASITTTTRRSAQLGLALGPDSTTTAFDGIVSHVPVSPDRARELAAAHLTGPAAARGITLSARLHTHDEATIRAMAHELHATITAGRTVQESAQRLLEVGDPHVHLPAYIRDVREVVRGGDARALRMVIDRHTRSVERLSTPEMRASGRDFMRRAETATAADLDRQIAYWTRDRALHQERVIVRTEAARVHHEAFLESTRDEPGVKGYRWNISGSHPKPDICDLFANQAIDDLGPGGYTEENLPDLPAHPSCMCFCTTILDDDHFERELASVTGEAPPGTPWVDSTHTTASDWLAQQPEHVQLQILGPTRHAAWLDDPARVIGPGGRIAPVWEVDGRAPLSRAFGPRVRVASVDPFGEAGSRRALPPAPAAPAAPLPPPPPSPTASVRAPRGPRPTRPARAVPATLPASPAAAARRDLATALRGGGRTLDQAGTRRALRDWISTTHGSALTSRDLAQPLHDRLEAMTSTRVRGSHYQSGLIKINRAVFRAARAAATSLNQGAALEDAEREALRTFFHEEMHGHSSMGRAYYNAGKVLEEAIVELHARELVEQLVEVAAGSLRGSAAYEPWIQDVRDIVRSQFPSETPAQIDGRIRAAGRQAWQAPITSAHHYVKRFADGLGIAPAQRAQVESRLHALRPR